MMSLTKVTLAKYLAYMHCAYAYFRLNVTVCHKDSKSVEITQWKNSAFGTANRDLVLKYLLIEMFVEENVRPRKSLGLYM